MPDTKLEDQLREYYGEDVYAQRKAAAQAKVNANIELTLREDVDLHPEEYYSGDQVVTRKVQLLYRDLIWLCVDRMKDKDYFGLLTLDNIIITGGGRYTIREIANNQHPKYQTLKQYPESLYNLSTMLHPRDTIYPSEFENFLYLLQRVNNRVNFLRQLYYHPSLLTAEEKGLLVYNGYGKIARRQRKNIETWNNLAKEMQHMSIEPPKPSKEQSQPSKEPTTSNQTISEKEDEVFKKYVEVFATKQNEYKKNGKGFVCYFKDVLQHLNELIDKYNEEEAIRCTEAKKEAEKKAIEDAEKKDITSEDEIYEMVTKAVQDVAENEVIPLSNLAKMVERLESFYEGALLHVYYFMIEEGIEFDLQERQIILLGQPKQRKPPQHVGPTTRSGFGGPVGQGQQAAAGQGQQGSSSATTWAKIAKGRGQQ